MYFDDPKEIEEKKLQKRRSADNTAFGMIMKLIVSNTFTTHELLVLIKYLLDHHPYPLDKIPPAYLEILEGRDTSSKR